MEKYLLQMEHVDKSFPGVRALSDVTLNVRYGSVHALLGENGAGKSTLMKCLFGIYHMDAGSWHRLIKSNKPLAGSRVMTT